MSRAPLLSAALLLAAGCTTGPGYDGPADGSATYGFINLDAIGPYLYGTAADSRTGAPVAVDVCVVKDSQPCSVGDASGHWELELDPDDVDLDTTVRLSADGYRPVDLRVSDFDRRYAVDVPMTPFPRAAPATTGAVVVALDADVLPNHLRVLHTGPDAATVTIERAPAPPRLADDPRRPRTRITVLGLPPGDVSLSLEQLDGTPVCSWTAAGEETQAILDASVTPDGVTFLTLDCE